MQGIPLLLPARSEVRVVVVVAGVGSRSKAKVLKLLRKINDLNCCGRGRSINIAVIFRIRVRNTQQYTNSHDLDHIICSLSTD